MPVGRAAWVFILIFSLSVFLYVGGGVGYAVKVEGRDLGEGLALLPHLAFWVEVRGLVEDGVRLTHLLINSFYPNERQNSENQFIALLNR